MAVKHHLLLAGQAVPPPPPCVFYLVVGMEHFAALGSNSCNRLNTEQFPPITYSDGNHDRNCIFYVTLTKFHERFGLQLLKRIIMDKECNSKELE